MPVHNIKKPNLGGNNLKTGFKLMSRGVSRGQSVQKPAVKSGIASNHPIASSRAALSGKKKSRMY